MIFIKPYTCKPQLPNIWCWYNSSLGPLSMLTPILSLWWYSQPFIRQQTNMNYRLLRLPEKAQLCRDESIWGRTGTGMVSQAALLSLWPCDCLLVRQVTVLGLQAWVLSHQNWYHLSFSTSPLKIIAWGSGVERGETDGKGKSEGVGWPFPFFLSLS